MKRRTRNDVWVDRKFHGGRQERTKKEDSWKLEGRNTRRRSGRHVETKREAATIGGRHSALRYTEAGETQLLHKTIARCTVRAKFITAGIRATA